MNDASDIDADVMPAVRDSNASAGTRMPTRTLCVEANDVDDARLRTALREMTWGIALDGQRERGFKQDQDGVESLIAMRRGIAIHERVVNARAESLTTSAMFSPLAKDAERRCVAYVDGFYEWVAEGPKSQEVKQPYLVKRIDGKPLALAGVFVERQYRCKEVSAVDAAGDTTREPPLTTITKRAYEAAIITVSSEGGPLQWLHDRMPLILREDIGEVDAWLSHESRWESLLTRPAREVRGLLAWHPVTTKVNSASYKGEDSCTPTTREILKNSGNLISMFANATKKSKLPNVVANDAYEKQPAKKPKVEKIAVVVPDDDAVINLT